MTKQNRLINIQTLGADDGVRTRDLRLGKATLYQLSYIRKQGNPTETELLMQAGKQV